jgi:hypothetical protein
LIPQRINSKNAASVLSEPINRLLQLCVTTIFGFVFMIWLESDTKVNQNQADRNPDQG